MKMSTNELLRMLWLIRKQIEDLENEIKEERDNGE